MEYRKDLPYQKEVVDRIIDILSIEDLFEDSKNGYSNPKVLFSDINKRKLKSKISQYNNKIDDKRLHLDSVVGDYLNLDIKMETGTGKTYTYVKTIYELAKIGIKKVIIVVPSLAIKAGTESFINDSSDYFERKYNNIKIWPFVQEKGNDGLVSTFVKDSIVSDNHIDVLLLNYSYLHDDNYGKTLEDPICEDYFEKSTAIASVNPFLIIDEPHRFKDGNATMRFIKEKIKPQCILRFGSTFPELNDQSANNGVIRRDYKNLIYDLSSRKAFLDNYIKGINIYTEGPNIDNVVKFKIKSIKKGESVSFEIKNEKRPKTVRKGNLIDFLGDEFKGVSIENISDKEVFLSNGKVLSKKNNKTNNRKTKDYLNEEDIEEYYTSYDFSLKTQEAMIKMALKKHFEKEKTNFKNKIKTISLFFFDDIDAYRDRGTGQKQWLKDMFENTLKDRLKDEIKELKESCNSDDVEYCSYLEATINNLKSNEGNKLVHAGYFADDKDKKEGSEFYRIIKDKEGMLNIYNVDNSFNTFRFIFSKWTLKEGWDNPNVFVIAKLSGSGSETSKLQEVGRGLRLPVDTNMKRIEGEQFYLAYIVNHNEKDFASRLLKEVCPGELITKDGKKYLTTSDIQHILENNDNMFDYVDQLRELIVKGVISPDNVIINGEKSYEVIDYTKFFEEYYKYLDDKKNEVDSIIDNKITIGDPKSAGKSRIRKENFEKIKKLWETLNQNFLISYKKESFSDEKMEELIYNALCDNIDKILNDENVTFDVVDANKMIEDNKHVLDEEDINNEYASVDNYRLIKYSDYIKKISRATNIPIIKIHRAIHKFINKQEETFDYNRIFRANIRDAIILYVKTEKHNMIEGLFSYVNIGQKKETKLTDSNGNLRASINSTDLGVYKFTGNAVISDKYLYEDVRYDSDLELSNLKTNIDDKIEVFGKIPKNSIRIPKIDGASCSPDFMYVVKDKDENVKKFNLIIESKNDESREQLRGTEKLTEKYMRKYFECLEENVNDENVSIKFDYQYAKDKVIDLIDEILKNDEN